MHGILLVDKPRGWTSHDVVQWVRKRLRTQTVGHGGTLDPAAEGLLVIAVGIATRLVQHATEADKSYVAHIVLGTSTTSDDLEGEPLAASPLTVHPPSRRDVDSVLTEFLGEYDQQPPIYSALKVGGVAAYRRARAGEPVTLVRRLVRVNSLRLVQYSYPDLVVSIDCGKGFYVRSFARDLGARLGTGAYLHGLVRTRVGRFSLASAWSIDALNDLLTPSSWPLIARHPDEFVAELPVLLVPERELRAWYHGAPVRCSASSLPGTTARAYAPDGNWIGLAQFDPQKRYWQPVLVHREGTGRRGKTPNADRSLLE
ncbi:tRNA pseudouridine(55) synthase TruB [Thermomicrobium sp.]